LPHRRASQKGDAGENRTYEARNAMLDTKTSSLSRHVTSVISYVYNFSSPQQRKRL